MRGEEEKRGEERKRGEGEKGEGDIFKLGISLYKFV